MNHRETIEQLKNHLETFKETNNGVELEKISRIVEQLEFSEQFKPYGLFFEDYLEDNVEALNDLKLIPTQLDDLNIYKDSEKPVNMLLEGDNYWALKALEKTHKGKVDVIYIDPPYNTGNKDFVYNDSYVNNEDAYRHSKWLSFMDKRLKLAKKLMSEDGVIFISIDDNEQAQLKMLCDQVFGEQNFISNFIWEKTQHTGRQKLNQYSNAEYILCYAKNLVTPSGNVRELLIESVQTTFEDAPLYNKSNNLKDLVFPKGSVFFKKGSEVQDTTNKSYKLLNAVKIVKTDSLNAPEGFNFVNDNDFVLQFKSRWSQKELDSQINEKGTVFLVKGDSFAIRALYDNSLKDSANNSPWQIIKTIGDNRTRIKNGTPVGTTQTGSSEVSDILGPNIFSYPKTKTLIKYLISLINNKNATVLDFFAGSGTTGQAVMELNKEDEGKRTFILATNNEVSPSKELQLLISKGFVPKTPEVKKGIEFIAWKQSIQDFKDSDAYIEFLLSEEYLNLGIARQVTYERLKRVINGYTTPKGKFVEGIPNNLKYILLETITEEKEKSGDYSQKDIVFFNENVIEDVESDYFLGINSEKEVYVVGSEEEAEDLINHLKENPTSKKIIIYTNITVMNYFKNTEYGNIFYKFPKL